MLRAPGNNFDKILAILRSMNICYHRGFLRCKPNQEIGNWVSWGRFSDCDDLVLIYNEACNLKEEVELCFLRLYLFIFIEIVRLMFSHVYLFFYYIILDELIITGSYHCLCHCR